MNFWWVNQNLTYAEESKGGYMWSPKTNRDGSKSHFYENMCRVVPGDIVFSFRNTVIPSIGIITSHAYSAPKPTEFGTAGKDWRRDGWRVDVEYHPLKKKVRPKDHIARIRPALAKKYSPLRRDGNGNQAVYLTEISQPLAMILADLIGPEADSVISSAEDATAAPDIPPDYSPEAEKKEAEINANQNLTTTEKTALVKARRGQGIFRKNVFDFEKRCRVTGVANPRYLIASHIKPWVQSTNAEKLDGANGLLLSPHIDHLFDTGNISFSDRGDVICSSQVDRAVLKQLHIDPTINVGSFCKEQLPYLAYHREFRLKR
jgi:hypothetical protein